MLKGLVLVALLGAGPAAAQEPAPGSNRGAAAPQPAADWQGLALRAQQNATVDQMVANGMLSALQAEVNELKAQLAKLQKDPPAPPEASK
jgi:hypothetical protein